MVFDDSRASWEKAVTTDRFGGVELFSEHACFQSGHFPGEVNYFVNTHAFNLDTFLGKWTILWTHMLSIWTLSWGSELFCEHTCFQSGHFPGEVNYFVNTHAFNLDTFLGKWTILWTHMLSIWTHSWGSELFCEHTCFQSGHIPGEVNYFVNTHAFNLDTFLGKWTILWTHMLSIWTHSWGSELFCEHTCFQSGHIPGEVNYFVNTHAFNLDTFLGKWTILWTHMLSIWTHSWGSELFCEHACFQSGHIPGEVNYFVNTHAFNLDTFLGKWTISWTRMLSIWTLYWGSELFFEHACFQSGHFPGEVNYFLNTHAFNLDTFLGKWTIFWTRMLLI